MFRDFGAHEPISIMFFPQRSQRSSGVCNFTTAEEAANALVLANHAALEGAVGQRPFIVKLAFSEGSKERRS